MAGVYATHSKWIDKEIKLATEGFGYRKPILAIKPRENFNVSRRVEENCNEIVNWNTESIVLAIRKLVDYGPYKLID